MKSKVRFLPFVIALALVTSMFVFSPASAATGTVSLDKSFITAEGGVLTVTLADKDLNVGVVQADETVGRDVSVFPVGNADYETPAAGVAAGASFRVYTQLTPVLDGDGNSVVNYLDITAKATVAGTEDSIFGLTLPGAGDSRHPSSAGAGGVVEFTNNTLGFIAGGIGFSLSYTADDVQTATVKVNSTQDATGFDLTLTETGASTGTFTGSFVTAAATDGIAVPPAIEAITGALVSVTYDDGGTSRVANATVETTAPTVTVLAPTDKTATRTQSTRLIAEVTDADSGVDTATANFQIVSAVDALNNPILGVEAVARTETAIAGGVRIEAQFNGIPQGQNTIKWNVTGTDKAGNVSTSADQEIRVDTVAPALGTLVAGFSAKTGQSLDADDVIVIDAALADPTFIRVLFNEKLDQSSVQASDFQVAGVAPAAVVMSSDHKDSVFLKVPTLPSNSTPTVEVVGNVSDEAGNEATGGLSTPSLDGIAPTITVTLSATLSTGAVTIDMASDEALLTAPVIVINGNEVPSGVAAGDLSATSLIGLNLFRATLTASEGPMAFNVEVSGTDTADNSRSVGATKIGDTGSISFEVDKVLPAPSIVFTGEDAANVFTQNPFITIDWADEANEYGRVEDVGGDSMANDGTQTADLDTHSSVTMTSITVDGVNVSGSMAAVSGNDGKYLLVLRDLSLATHKLTFTGEDAAGNTLTVTDSEFTVKERPAFSIGMTPGWNLVSIPAEPKANAINDVIAAGHSASIVITYDPSEAGGWLTATRGSDGLFAGTLTEIKASRAYWIFTESFDAISVPLQSIGGGTTNLLPTISLVAGWNLLPVLDVSGTKVFGDSAGTPASLIGTSPVRTYEFNAGADRFDQISGACVVAGDPGCALVGVGYWAYMGSASTYVP